MDAAPTLRRVALFSALSLLVAGALSLVGDRGTAAATAAETSASVGALRICSNCAATGGDLSRYRYVVLHSWEHGRIAGLKAANPNVKVLVYKELPGTYDYACHNGVDDQLLAAGVGYCAADRQHPNWFLTDTSGSRIQFCDYQGIWQMDPGNTAYQDEWLKNVSADMKAHGWDGVMLDDANSTEKYHLCGKTIAKYPTEASYEAATKSFLARVGPALMHQGFLVLPNINFDCWETCWSSFIQYTSGATREWWTKSTTGTGGQYADASWDWANSFLRITQNANKVFLAITYAPSTDLRSQRYARASFLIDWNGGASALVFDPGAGDPWSSEWTMDIGTPKGARYRSGGAWRRDYTGGTVLVNPSSSASATVSLGGKFLAPEGAQVTSVTLQPTSGLILRNSGAPAPAPAPTPPAQPSAPTKTTPPVISVLRHQNVAASPGAWTGNPTFSYQWLRCDGAGACSQIAGAMASTYHLARVDVGFLLKIRVTGTNTAGSTVAESGPISVVGSGNSNPRALLSVKGARVAAPTGSGHGAFGAAGPHRHRFSFRFGPSSARVTFVDRRSRSHLRSLSIVRIRVSGSRVLVQGRGKLGRHKVWFSATGIDRGPGRRDFFRIRMSNGYGASGRLVAGSITVH